MVRVIIFAGIGGFLGTILRFIISRYFQVYTYSSFPWGTFWINIIGSLLIGILYGIFEKGDFIAPEWRIFLTVGFCGGFTTFSTFSNEGFLLLQNREFFQLAVYAGLSLFFGLMAVFFGRLIVKNI